MKLAYGWDLLWQLDILRNRNAACLDRALQIDIWNLLAQIRLLVDQSNQSIFDLQKHLGPLLDVLAQRAHSFDRECLPTMDRLACTTPKFAREYARNRRIGSQVDLLQRKDIAGMVCFAERKRVIARHLSTVAEHALAATEER